MPTPHQVRINEIRFKRNFDELTAIGATPEGGCERLAFSQEDSLARQWFKSKVSSSGMTYWIDGAGNQFGILGDRPVAEGAILIGSHLDTVPDGGKYDGALGVVAAIEACQSVLDANLACRHPICVVNFSDEEGTHVGLLGSRVFTGILSPAALDGFHSGEKAFEDGMRRIGITHESIFSASCAPRPPHSYLELHIEQGPVLEDSGQQIGIVTSIVGIRTRRVVFRGRAMHAGTTPMKLRRDAGFGACSFAKAARELVLERFPDNVANIGSIEMKPGAFNVIPEYRFSFS